MPRRDGGGDRRRVALPAPLLYDSFLTGVSSAGNHIWRASFARFLAA